MSSNPLNDLTVLQLKEKLRELEVTGYSNLRKKDLITLLNIQYKNKSEKKENEPFVPFQGVGRTLNQKSPRSRSSSPSRIVGPVEPPHLLQEVLK
jgi:hypothetical protein